MWKVCFNINKQAVKCMAIKDSEGQVFMLKHRGGSGLTYTLYDIFKMWIGDDVIWIGGD